jgi:hypothetical protein
MENMGWLRSAVAALLLVLGAASPGLARIASIETTAPLSNHAEQTVKAALEEAVNTAVKGAVAMGLRWFKISKALVLEDLVAVQILATDTASEPEGVEPEGEAAPESENDLETVPDRPAGFLM